MYKHQINGENGKNLTLKEVLATNKFASYGTDSLEEYMNSIKSMNLSDLHHHAIKLGVKPHSERKRMEKILAQEFTRTKSQYLASCNQVKDFANSEAQVEKRQRALEILKSTK
jgi:hypothetical protein